MPTNAFDAWRRNSPHYDDTHKALTACIRVVIHREIDRIYREVRIVAIGGGLEEILLDLAGRQLGYGAN